MTIQQLRDQLGDYAKDIKLNLGKVLEEDGAPGLSKNQIFGIALASAYATKHPAVIAAFEAETATILSAEEVNAARAAATIMGMNNVYYRFVHLVSDKEYGRMPANLRMNVIGNPGIEKVSFELMSLAVSAINGCGMCMDAHVNEVIKGGVSKQGVQSSIRIGAVIAAVAQALVMGTGNAALSAVA
ncbi:alkyl hydroperoxide reductase [bacterium]|nr:alkyl hydroperoxide reductase [bacterium]